MRENDNHLQPSYDNTKLSKQINISEPITLIASEYEGFIQGY